MKGGPASQMLESREEEWCALRDSNSRPSVRGQTPVSFHGSIQLEHKDDLKAHGEASPDDADTLAMTFSVKLAPKPKQGRLRQPEVISDFGWMAVG